MPLRSEPRVVIGRSSDASHSSGAPLESHRRIPRIAVARGRRVQRPKALHRTTTSGIQHDPRSSRRWTSPSCEIQRACSRPAAASPATNSSGDHDPPSRRSRCSVKGVGCLHRRIHRQLRRRSEDRRGRSPVAPISWHSLRMCSHFQLQCPELLPPGWIEVEPLSAKSARRAARARATAAPPSPVIARARWPPLTSLLISTQLHIARSPARLHACDAPHDEIASRCQASGISERDFASFATSRDPPGAGR